MRKPSAPRRVSAGRARQRAHRDAVADAVRRLRAQRGWSQQRLADKLGWDVTAVKRLEASRHSVELSVIEELAMAFECTVAPLLGSLYPDAARTDDVIKAELSKLETLVIRKAVDALLAGDRRERIEEAAAQLLYLPRGDFDHQCENVRLVFNDRRDRGELSVPNLDEEVKK